jgi:superfamily II DNA helicase RecQ
MQLRFFHVPVLGGEEAAEALNRFLSSRRILGLERELVQDGANSAWALCVSYEEPAGPSRSGKRGQVDYKERLSEADFVVYARLRSLRKELAERDEVPAYTVFTNEQLAAMVQGRATSPEALLEIPGVGQARVDKYGEAFLALLRQAQPAGDSGGSDAD